MLDLLSGFIIELRNAGLPVSLTENLDAMHAISHIPLEDREAFKYALGATLVKNNAHWRSFETVFEVYFSLRGPEYSITDGDGEGSIDDLLQQMQDAQMKGEGNGGAGGLDSLTPEELMNILMNALMNGDQALMRALARQAVQRFAGMEPGRPVGGTYYLYRTLRNLDLDGMLDKLMDASREEVGGDLTQLEERLERDEYNDRIEQFKKEIEAEIRKQGAQRKFAESAEAFTNGVYEQPDSLKPVADRLKLEIRTATGVLRKVPDGTSGVLANGKFRTALFGDDAVQRKRNTEAVDLGGSQLVSARVLVHTPARLPAFDDVKDVVRAAVVEEQAAALARKEGQERLAALKQNPAQALPQTAVLSRNQSQGVPRSLMEAVLLAPQDKLPAPIGVDLGTSGYVVARVLKVLPREQAAATDALLVPQLAQAWGAAESDAYLATLKRRFKAEIEPAARKADAPAAAASQ
jgi:hypothetical protein